MHDARDLWHWEKLEMSPPICVHILVHVRVQQADWLVRNDDRQHVCQVRMWAPKHCLLYIHVSGTHLVLQTFQREELPGAALKRSDDPPFRSLSQNLLAGLSKTSIVIPLEIVVADVWNISTTVTSRHRRTTFRHGFGNASRALVIPRCRRCVNSRCWECFHPWCH
jgi:hypothetical protein